MAIGERIHRPALNRNGLSIHHLRQKSLEVTTGRPRSLIQEKRPSSRQQQQQQQQHGRMVLLLQDQNPIAWMCLHQVSEGLSVFKLLELSDVRVIRGVLLMNAHLETGR